MLFKKKILIISPEAWGENFVSKHHYAIELLNRGNTVYFFNPPKKKAFSNLSIRKVEEHDGLRIIDMSVKFRGLNRLPAKVADWINRKTVQRLLKHIGPIDVVWSFDPYRFQNLGHFNAKCKIYHPVDVHNTSQEFRIIDHADLVLGSSQKILDKFNEKQLISFKVNHGLASHFLLPQGHDHVELPGAKSKVKVGYVGNLNYNYLDKEILVKILKGSPDVNFYFIGPVKKSNLSSTEGNQDIIRFISTLPNAFLLGVVPSKELPGYLALFDAFLMCYTGDRYVSQMANPHKILEYLSTGKVVVSHYIDEYKDKPHLLEMCKSNAELPARFKQVVKDISNFNSKEKALLRREFASQNTYSDQLNRINEILYRVY